MTLAGADIGAGGTAFLVVLALIIAMVLIFIAMVRSFRRLRKSVSDGTFGHPEAAPRPPVDPETGDPVSHDQTPGGAAV